MCFACFRHRLFALTGVLVARIDLVFVSALAGIGVQGRLEEANKSYSIAQLYVTQYRLCEMDSFGLLRGCAWS